LGSETGWGIYHWPHELCIIAGGP